MLEMGFTECILLSSRDISYPRICTYWLEYKICMGFFVCYGQRWGEAVSPAFPRSGTGKADKGEDVRWRFTFPPLCLCQTDSKKCPKMHATVTVGLQSKSPLLMNFKLYHHCSFCFLT